MAKDAHEIFARLGETPFGQVLLTLQRGEDSTGNEGPTIRIRISERHGITPEATLGPWPDTDAGWAQAQSSFDKADLQTTARDMATSIDKMLGKATA